jgi:hypothetical protein
VSATSANASPIQTLRDIVRGIDNRRLKFTGLNALRRGLRLGREHAYWHFLWWRPAAVARVLVYAALEVGIEPALRLIHLPRPGRFKPSVTDW